MWRVGGEGDRGLSYSAEETGLVDLSGARGSNVAVSGVVHGAITVLNVVGPPFTLAAILGPAVVLALNWQEARSHPIWFIAGPAGCWLGLGLLRVVIDVAARRFESITATTDALLGRSLSRYHHHYREWVLRRNRHPRPSRPLPTAGSVSPELDDIFVDVSVVPRASHLVPGGLLADAPADVGQRHSIWDFLGRREPQSMVLLGAPGSGKSTLLRHVARRIANRAPLPGRRWLPVLIELRAHAEIVIDDPAIGLPALVSTVLADLPRAEPPGWWRSKLVSGRCVVLLDGLDEIPGIEARAQVLAWLRKQIADYGRNHFVLSSRPFGYDKLRSDVLKTLQVRPFTEEQVKVFVHKWYTATEREETHDRKTADARAQAGSADLIERLKAGSALRDLMVNPLLLTMIANVHRHRQALPESRVRLYAEVFEVLLGPRGDGLVRDDARKVRQAEQQLAEIAFRFMSAGTTVMPRDELSSRGMTVARQSGILVELDERHYSFAHLTFQEYLAARHIRQHKLVDVLIDGINTSWWRETTLMWAADQSADDVVRACLGSGKIGALSLAFECADIDQAVSPDLRERLQELVDAAYEPDAHPERRRVVAGIEALRYVRRSEPTLSGSRLCREPVPGRLYWLFVRSGHRGPDRPCEPETPIARGMWGRDALDFVDWINEATRDGGDPDTSYRLPTAIEIAELAARDAVWVAGRSSALPELRVPPGRRSPSAITGAELRTSFHHESAEVLLLLDVLSVGVRARVHALTRLIDKTAARADRALIYLDEVAAEPFQESGIAHEPSNNDVLIQKMHEARNPYKREAALLRKNIGSINLVRTAIATLVGVVTGRDIGGTCSIEGLRSARKADAALDNVHRMVAKIGVAPEVPSFSRVRSRSDVMEFHKFWDGVHDSALAAVRKIEEATASFRRVRVVTGRPWRPAAWSVDQSAPSVDAASDVIADMLVDATMGRALGAARMRVLAERRPDDPAGALVSFVDALIGMIGVSDTDQITGSLDWVSEKLPALLDLKLGVGTGLAPLVGRLRDLIPPVFSRSGAPGHSCREIRMIALALAASAQDSTTYLETAAAALVLERRNADRATETIYLASM